jgi:hypothetical protein
MIKRCGGAAIAMLVAVATGSAQGPYIWSEIDCTQSRLAPIAGTSCRTTNSVTGGDAAGGTGQRHSVRGTTEQGYVLLSLSEAIGSGAYVLTRMPVADYLKALDKRAANGTDWSGITAYGGADYSTFRSGEAESCVGFRKLGEKRNAGFAWIMHGLLCAPEGQTLQPAQMNQFIDDARVR